MSSGDRDEVDTSYLLHQTRRQSKRSLWMWLVIGGIAVVSAVGAFVLLG